MVKPLWQLCAEDPPALTCEECFTVMQYYAELLADGGADLLPQVIEHLRGCPDCRVRHREALRRLLASQSETSTTPAADLAESCAGEEEE